MDADEIAWTSTRFQAFLTGLWLAAFYSAYAVAWQFFTPTAITSAAVALVMAIPLFLVGGAFGLTRGPMWLPFVVSLAPLLIGVLATATSMTSRCGDASPCPELLLATGLPLALSIYTIPSTFIGQIVGRWITRTTPVTPAGP